MNKILFIEFDVTREEKIKDIISTLLAYGLMDYERAKRDNEYLRECISTYVEAANIARESMNMPLIDLEL